MYTLGDRSQLQAHVIKTGQHKLAKEHQEVIDWINTTFDVRVLDFYFEMKQKQLVHLILEDVKTLQSNRDAAKAIAGRFLQYFKSNSGKTDDVTKGDAFSSSTNPFPEIIVTYRPLDVPDSEVISKIIQDEKYAALKTFENVWTMSMGVIFYYTDREVKENETNGMSDKISKTIEAIDAKYADGQSASYRFDSKESFDRDYQSNWHYYWQ